MKIRIYIVSGARAWALKAQRGRAGVFENSLNPILTRFSLGVSQASEPMGLRMKGKREKAIKIPSIDLIS